MQQIYIINEDNPAAISLRDKLMEAAQRGEDGAILMLTADEMRAWHDQSQFSQSWIQGANDDGRPQDAGPYGHDVITPLHMALVEMVEIMASIEPYIQNRKVREKLSKRFGIMRRTWDAMDPTMRERVRLSTEGEYPMHKVEASLEGDD